jgi:uncharacterized protein YceK
MRLYYVIFIVFSGCGGLGVSLRCSGQGTHKLKKESKKENHNVDASRWSGREPTDLL